ncbi:MAG: tRNA 2-thiouridine(34) synthase MnmA [Phycisphaeraceae bacterium]|nr:tRNA 2-thiouridine(34) synthase MnmA [Phycisphaeraceae bacterium]
MASKGRVLVAMSGGVDSSVAAALLKQQGYEPVGCFMRLGTPEEASGPPSLLADSCPPRQAKQGCCSVGDAADARLVAAELGIPLYVCNFAREFDRIIEYFADQYEAGRTPNPCVRCNDWLKFGKLFGYADQIGARFVASGHYARVGESPDGTRLHRAIDRDKDQSYVLFGVSPDRLARTLLPIGEMRKSEVRSLAEELSLPVFEKPDSQEICFVPENDYASLVERRKPNVAANGEIVDEDGRVVAHHAGQHRFTVGQRRGLGIASSHPLYVLERDPKRNRVVVGARDRLRTSGCEAGEFTWHEAAPGRRERECFAQYRAHGESIPAFATGLSPADDPGPSGRCGRTLIRFGRVADAVAPGQAVVLYDARTDQIVLGGGWITRAEREARVARPDQPA